MSELMEDNHKMLLIKDKWNQVDYKTEFKQEVEPTVDADSISVPIPDTVRTDDRQCSSSSSTKKVGGRAVFICSYCKKEFHWLSTITRHMRTHTGEKPYQCSQCNTCFSRVSHLNRHMGIHTGKKPFQCSQCNACFNRASHLTRHMRIHTGEKPFQCSQCNACFNQVIHLTRHMGIHTGKKPFQCSQCNACFNRVSHLKRHTIIHTGEKPFRCSTCERRFRDLITSTTVNSIPTIHVNNCVPCSKAYTSKGELKRHLRSTAHIPTKD